MEPQAELSGPYRLRGKGKFSTPHKLQLGSDICTSPVLRLDQIRFFNKMGGR